MNAPRWLLVLVLCGLALAACGPREPAEVAFDDLVGDPAAYDGELICTDGVYAAGFELSALAAGTAERGGELTLTEPALWLDGVEPQVEGDCSEYRGYSFCPARACGLFETGGSFGHLGAYEHQLRDPAR